jgi:hypothetical protein
MEGIRDLYWIRGSGKERYWKKSPICGGMEDNESVDKMWEMDLNQLSMRVQSVH